MNQPNLSDMSSEVDTTGAPTDTRKQLLDAAIEVFLEKGYGSTRVQDIAQRAGYTAGALYVHFPGRAALLNEALSIEGKAILTSMVETLNSTGTDGLSGLLRFVEQGNGETTRFDLLLVESLAVAAREPQARLALTGVLDEMAQAVDRQIFDAKKDGRISTDTNEPALRHLLLTFIFGSVLTKNLGFPNGGTDATAEVLGRMVGGLKD